MRSVSVVVEMKFLGKLRQNSWVTHYHIAAPNIKRNRQMTTYEAEILSGWQEKKHISTTFIPRFYSNAHERAPWSSQTIVIVNVQKKPRFWKNATAWHAKLRYTSPAFTGILIQVGAATCANR